MHTLFYCRVASRIMQDSDILDNLKVSRDKNSQHLITGILVYRKKSREVFQILEGEDEKIQERSFKNWRMVFADLDPVENSKLDGFSEYFDKGFTSELSQENIDKANRVIKIFQHYLSDFNRS